MVKKGEVRIGSNNMVEKGGRFRFFPARGRGSYILQRTTGLEYDKSSSVSSTMDLRLTHSKEER